MTRVSVVICSYNSAQTLGAALRSALTQSFPSDEYEVLLVNDGSTDKTSEVADSYCSRHSNLRYIQFPVNKGLVAACNYGINAALGAYIIRLDADDTFHLDILSSCVATLERDETDLVYCDRYEVNLSDQTRKLVQMEPFNLFDMIAAGAMLRAELLREVGGYRRFFWEEYDLYMRYLQRSGRPPVRIPRPLYYYSRHPASMTADKARVQKGWKELREAWGDDALRSFGWSGQGQEALQ